LDATPGYRPAYELAVDRVLVYIADHDLGPGDRLPTEADLARELQLGQRTVREALKMLSAIGRVRAERGRGLFVGDEVSRLGGPRPTRFRPTDLEHIAMLFEFRVVQERASAEFAAERARPRELDAMAGAIRDGAEAAAAGDLVAFGAADEGFHVALAEAGRNVFFVDAVARIRALQSQVSYLELDQQIPDAARSLDEHRAILQAVSRGQQEEAGRLAAEHVRQAHADYRSAIAGGPSGPAPQPTGA
jgi:DNA-binding FadR family transcriptional regulator